MVKDNLEAIGFRVELVQVDAAIYFDSAAGNEQNLQHFYWDIDMYQQVPDSPRPISFLEAWFGLAAFSYDYWNIANWNFNPE